MSLPSSEKQSKVHKRKQGSERLKMLWHYAQAERKNLLLGLVLQALKIIALLLGPWFLADFLNHELVEGVGVRSVQRFLIFLTLYFLLILFSAIVSYGSGMTLSKSSLRIARNMQTEAYRHVQSLPLSYFDRQAAGSIVSRIVNDTRNIETYYRLILTQFLASSFYILATLVMLLLLDLRLFALALLPAPLAVLMILIVRRRMGRYAKAYRQSIASINGQINENIQGIEVLQALGKEETALNKFKDEIEQQYRYGIYMTKTMAWGSYTATTGLEFLSLALILFFFGYTNISPSVLPLPIGSLYIFVEYMVRLFQQVNNLNNQILSLQRSAGAADHFMELLKEETDQDPAPASEFSFLPSEAGKVQFEDVTFAYKTEPVLKHVSFQVSPGQSVAFVGHTGSGKSTVMNLLLGFYRPQEGHIRLNGIDLEDQSRKQARSSIAIVMQDPFLFEGTVYSNISLNHPDITREKALQALLDVGGQGFMERHPEGLDTPVKERGQSFSAGEKQLISFARALAQDPLILVLDEATAHIDTETEQIIQKGIQRLKQDRTTLIIAHRLSTIRDSNRIFVLDHGVIIEEGSHDELIQANGLYKQMYEAQSLAR